MAFALLTTVGWDWLSDALSMIDRRHHRVAADAVRAPNPSWPAWSQFPPEIPPGAKDVRQTLNLDEGHQWVSFDADGPGLLALLRKTVAVSAIYARTVLPLIDSGDVHWPEELKYGVADTSTLASGYYFFRTVDHRLTGAVARRSTRIYLWSRDSHTRSVSLP